MENDRYENYNNRFHRGLYFIIGIYTFNGSLSLSTLRVTKRTNEQWGWFLYSGKSHYYSLNLTLPNQMLQQHLFCHDENTVPVTHIITAVSIESGRRSFHFPDCFLEIQKNDCKSWGNTIRETFSTFLIPFRINIFIDAAAFQWVEKPKL